MEIQQLLHDIETFQNERNQASNVLKKLELEYAWIQDHRALFGIKGSEYDFEKVNIGESKKQLLHLKERHVLLSKNLDHQVLDKFDR